MAVINVECTLTIRKHSELRQRQRDKSENDTGECSWQFSDCPVPQEKWRWGKWRQYPTLQCTAYL